MKRKFTKYPITSARSSSNYRPRGANTDSARPSVDNTYNGRKFDKEQMKEIRKGLEQGLDVSVYADPKFDWSQMSGIRRGLAEGVDASVYADPKFDWGQMNQIREGLKAGLDVSIYADPKFDDNQMIEIRQGLQNGVDVSVYADPKFDDKKMEQIRKSLQSGLPADYDSLSKSERSKASWDRVKQQIASENYQSVADIENGFDLGTLEGSAANKLGVSFDEAADGSINFTDRSGIDLGSLTADEFDDIVIDAIKNSSTRSAFTKAFAVRLKRRLGL